MSEEIYAQNGITVTRYLGPALEISGLPDRARWQITMAGPCMTAMLRPEVAELAVALLESAGERVEPTSDLDTAVLAVGEHATRLLNLLQPWGIAPEAVRRECVELTLALARVPRLAVEL